jgi:hypothetical protein
MLLQLSANEPHPERKRIAASAAARSEIFVFMGQIRGIRGQAIVGLRRPARLGDRRSLDACEWFARIVDLYLPGRRAHRLPMQ